MLVGVLALVVAFAVGFAAGHLRGYAVGSREAVQGTSRLVALTAGRAKQRARQDLGPRDRRLVYEAVDNFVLELDLRQGAVALIEGRRR